MDQNNSDTRQLVAEILERMPLDYLERLRALLDDPGAIRAAANKLLCRFEELIRPGTTDGDRDAWIETRVQELETQPRNGRKTREELVAQAEREYATARARAAQRRGPAATGRRQ